MDVGRWLIRAIEELTAVSLVESVTVTVVNRVCAYQDKRTNKTATHTKNFQQRYLVTFTAFALNTANAMSIGRIDYSASQKNIKKVTECRRSAAHLLTHHG